MEHWRDWLRDGRRAWLGWAFLVNKYSNITTMFVWGRNNNHLFKQNHKKTYSVPQRVPLGRQVSKCVAGYDYILMLSSNSLFCYFQSAIYHLSHFNNAIDIATTDNMIVVVAADGTPTIAEFNADKIITGELTYSHIHMKQKVVRAFMNYGEIFLLDDSQQVFHLKRNQWYETKSYSDPQLVQGLGAKKIKTIAPAFTHNYFLSEDGKVFISTKKDPTKAVLSGYKDKFVEIAAAEYFIGIGENGRLYICGKFLDKSFDVPTQFGKISQRFAKIHLSSDNGFGITEKGEGWVWGKNANGQLGISDYEPRTQPFPLITLQNDIIGEFILGEGYTICLIQSPHTKKPRTKACELVSESVFHLQQPSKANKFMISSIPPINIAEGKKNGKSKSPNSRILIKTELVRDNPHKHQKADSNTPTKSFNRSKSPNQNRSASKSPVSKYVSPHLQNAKQKSLSNCKQKKELAKPATPRKSQAQFTSQIQALQDENGKLKQMLRIKDEVIEDITSKIRLLEDAIEQHERTLTNRDHLMEEYEKREKEYLSHIDQLQKTIQELMKSKSDRPSEHIDGIFQDLKSEFNKEKDYYMCKMKEYEDLLNNERTHYNAKIKQLEEVVDTYRGNQPKGQHLYTLHQSRNQPLCDRNHKENMRQSNESAMRMRLQEENRQKMELIVSRIEDSKVRIGKSATKLTEFLND